LPGAWLGYRFRRQGRQGLMVTVVCLIAFLVMFILSITHFSERLPASFYLSFGFAVSLACGFQFPVALHIKGGDNMAATRAFSADLIGAGCGILLTSVILIPYVGLLWTAVGLIGLKLASFTLIGIDKRKES